MKRGVIIGVLSVAALAALGGLWLWERTRTAALAPDELRHPGPAPPPPPRLREDCPDVMQALAASASGSERSKLAKSKIPLSQDELAIYRAVLEQRRSQGWRSLNISARTYPLDATDLRGLSVCECLNDVYLDGSSTAFRSFHQLTAAVLPGRNMELVDPDAQGEMVRTNDPGKTIGEGKTPDEAVREAESTGLFSLSEIVFDREHRYALVSYSFLCGVNCGSGATLLFEKIAGQWTRTARDCGGWIS